MEINYIHNVKDFSISKQEKYASAIGFFDGVHLGHRQLVQETQKIAKQKRLKSAVMTFYPHPKEVVQKGDKVEYIMTLDDKIKTFKSLGIDKVFIVNFNSLFASLPPEDFIKEFIVKPQITHVIVGFDFTYGKRGLGNANTIKEHSDNKVEITIVPKFQINNEKVSSTLIRQLLRRGEIKKVNALLGKPFESKVECSHVFSLGANNVFVRAKLNQQTILPPLGIYNGCININKYLYRCLIYYDNSQFIIEIREFLPQQLTTDFTLQWLSRKEQLPMKVNEGTEKSFTQKLGV